MVDASCIGHTKWNEFIRFLTPKLLNMGEADFTKQDSENLDKLRAALDAKFEYIGNKVIESAFQRMVWKWLRSN